MNDRLTGLQKWLKGKNAGAMLVSAPINIFYLSGFKSDPHERFLGLFVFQDGPAVLVCPAMEIENVRQTDFDGEVIGYSDHENPWDKIASLFKSKTDTTQMTLAAELTHLTYSRAQDLQQLGGQVELIDAEEAIGKLRRIKTAGEIKAMQKAAEMADFAVQTGIKAIKKGRTEQAIIAEIEYELTKRGYSEMAFTTMVLTGEKTALPHGRPGSRQIKEGDFVLFDLGIVADGYCSDITRTVVYKHASEEQMKIYDTVLQAEMKAIEEVKTGMKIGDLDKVARKVIEAAGYGEYFTHRLGHGLGIEAHEAPSMSENNTDTFEDGMAFTVEPGIYIPGTGGVRIEDDIVLENGQPRILTQYPKELQVIE